MEIVDPRIHPALLPAGSKAQVINGPKKEWQDLPAIRTPKHVISRWSPNEAERLAILRGEDIYVTLLSNGTINPFFVTVGQADWSVL